MRQPSLDDLTAFLTIVEQQSFRRAARVLDVSPSALSHMMRTLEDRVGARLLNRTTRSVAPSAAGARLAERLRPAVAAIGEAFDDLAERGERLTGRISVSTMEVGAQILVEQAIGGFRDRHPDVAFEIAVDVALIDLIAGGFDAGIRLREQVPPDMIALPIAPPTAMVAVASPDYLKDRTPPRQPSELLAHRCIRQRLASGAIYRWEFEVAGRPVLIDPPGSLTLNSVNVIVRAAVRGLGIAFAPLHQVAADLEAGRLVQLLADCSPTFDGLCFYYPSARHPTRAFAAFVEHVRTLRLAEGHDPIKAAELMVKP